MLLRGRLSGAPCPNAPLEGGHLGAGVNTRHAAEAARSDSRAPAGANRCRRPTRPGRGRDRLPFTHPPRVEIKGDALLVAVQDLLQVPVREKDAAFQERVRGLAGQLLQPVAKATVVGGIVTRSRD